MGCGATDRRHRRFTGADPYRLVVSGRVQHYLNITGEELLVDSTDAAARAVCAVYDLTLNDYMVAEEDGVSDNARHLWLLEVAHPVTIDAATLAAALITSSSTTTTITPSLVVLAR
ncbi:MAG: hypothetical protein R2873_35710 [Caldilineaceae bacterium]